MTIKTKIKAGALISNHNQSGIAIKSKMKAGAITNNHNQSVRKA